MKKIVATAFIVEGKAEAFHERLQRRISELQERGLDVEVQYCPNGVFTALLIATCEVPDDD